MTLPVQPDFNGNFTSLTVVWSGIGFNSTDGFQDIGQDFAPVQALLDSGTTTSLIPDELADDIYGGLGVTVVSLPYYKQIRPWTHTNKIRNKRTTLSGPSSPAAMARTVQVQASSSTLVVPTAPTSPSRSPSCYTQNLTRTAIY